MAQIGQFQYYKCATIVEFLLKKFFYFFFIPGLGGTVAQMTIMTYISMTYIVPPMCHHLSSQATFLFFGNKYMSKNSTITRSYDGRS